MTTRRSFVAGGAVGALALTSGCLDVITGSEPLTFDARRAAPSDAAVDETGYAERDRSEENIEETIDVGVERDIRATVHSTIYTKAVEIQGRRMEAAAFGVVSMPGMEVLGKSFNPLDDMSNREILEEVRPELERSVGELRDVRHGEERSLSILGESRTVDVFGAKTTLEGREIELRILLAAVDHEDDTIVLLGGYPRMLPDEGANVEVLMESIEHPL